MEKNKKKIKVKFVGFWKDFDEKDNFIIDILNSHFHVILSEDPEYLFYSVFNDDFIKYDCVRIFITGENVCPDFQMCDYAVGFEHMDFGDRYLRCPFYFFMEEYREDLYAAHQKHLTALDWLSKKTEFCSFVYSNSDADEMRIKIYEALCTYKKVNAGGKVANSYNGRLVDSKRMFELKHKFSIACENCSHSGYVTEKILQSFAAMTVPIYWGAPDVEKDFNKDAFINVGNFSSLEELVDYVRKVDEDETLFRKYLSEPAFSENISLEEMQSKLKSFLYYICNQNSKEAFRRSRILWGRMYQRRYWVYKRAYGFILKLKKVFGQKFVDWIEGTRYD